MSDLLPAADGLFLGSDSRRWDGHRLKNVVRPTLFGMNLFPPATTSDYLWFSEYNSGSIAAVEVKVPAGKTFNLWAMGLMDCGFPDCARLVCFNESTGENLQATTYGVFYEEYYPPKSVSGQVIMRLKGGNNHPSEYNKISGFMVLSIE